MKNTMMVLAVCLMACVSLSAQPPRGGQQRGVNFDEIPGITAEQKQKVEKIQADQREEMQKAFGQNRQAGQQPTQAQREERMKKMNELRDASLKEIEKVLTPEQFKVYKEKQDALRQRRGQGQRRNSQPGTN